jgi:hypothetical protein
MFLFITMSSFEKIDLSLMQSSKSDRSDCKLNSTDNMVCKLPIANLIEISFLVLVMKHANRWMKLHGFPYIISLILLLRIREIQPFSCLCSALLNIRLEFSVVSDQIRFLVRHILYTASESLGSWTLSIVRYCRN